MKTLKIIMLLAVAMLMFGCATGRSYPDHAFKKPIDSISIVHPVELEKRGVEYITIFYTMMDPALYTEMPGARGVWPLIGMSDDGDFLVSYAYFWDVTPWCEPMLKAEVQISKEELKKYRLLYSSMDGQFLYTLDGKQVPSFSKDENILVYNPRRFKKNNKHGEDIFKKYGKKIGDVGTYWNNYIKEKNPDAPDIEDSMVTEVKVGSPLWETYKEDLKQITASKPKLINGEIRLSFISLSEFKGKYVERPGFNNKERVLKRGLNIPVLPIMGVNTFIIAGANFASNVVGASIDDRLTGYYATAETMRYSMAPMFRHVVSRCKGLLEKRDMKIRELIERNKILRKIANDH